MASSKSVSVSRTSKRLRVNGEVNGTKITDEPAHETLQVTSSVKKKTRNSAMVKEADVTGLDPSSVPIVEQCSTDKSSHDESTEQAEENSNSVQDGIAELSKEQKIRMELNKAVARAKRNLRICEEHIAQSRRQGKTFPDFQELLVEKSWLEELQEEFTKQYMSKLHTFVTQESAGKVPIYPPPALIFNAFNTCPLEKVKVVIIGQDPYHGPGQAMGLSFSVPQGVKTPPSLMNIFKEIHTDIGSQIPKHGNLEKWAHQGVLLLNAVLTVRDHHPNSHAKKGWEPFTDAAIRAVSKQKEGIVFLLWGNSAIEKTRLINTTKHHILKAAHPSGLSCHKGFFNCRHFSETNKVLENAGELPIDWQL